MKKKVYFVGACLLLTAFMTACSCSSNPASNGSGSSSESESEKSSSSHSADELAQYVSGLKKTSVSNHLYFHYLRNGNTPSKYADWDVWLWPYRPVEGEGAKFDWVGRTASSSNQLSVSGDATVDDFGGAYIDVDLAKTYDGGWNETSKKMGGTSVKYTDDAGNLEEQLGLQVVQSSTRTSGTSFWTNDGGNNYLPLANYKMENSDGTFSYHVFAKQYHVNGGEMTALPDGLDPNDPFATDTGENVTYGKTTYANASSTDKQMMATSKAFLDGDASSPLASHGAGVGYQIMVSSFADSDGDGFGDIQGIIDKLDYLNSLHVNALWLTPIQMSDSYHGYDISDYEQVDPKFGSKVSEAAKANNGVVTAETAMKDYQALLKAAHEKGMAVVMDLVLNHTSTTNKWFIKSAQLDSKYRGYYQWGNHDTNKSKINVSDYWYPYGDTHYSYYAKFGSGMPELNYMFQDTRTAVAGIANAWAALGVDGFRMDAVKHIFLKDEIDTSVASMANDTIIDDSGSGTDYSSDLTKNLNFWKEFAYDVKSKNPNIFLVGENFDGSAFHVAPFYTAFDSMFDFYGYFNFTSAANTAMGRGLCSSVSFSSIAGKRDDTGLGAGGSYTPGATGNGETNASTSIKYGGTWDLRSELETNHKYRNDGIGVSSSTGFKSIGGFFTSNHDISRCINRIYGGAGSSTGLTSQGEISSSNYASYDKEATLVQIAELMMPGLTWIYYGDELGMTGNLQGKAPTAGYADLAYRQPMKWKQDGAVGDGSYTCGYSITGSGTGVKLDNINSTSTVADAMAQTAATSSHFAALASFASYKSTIPALIKGTYIPNNWDNMTNYLNFRRVLGSKAYHVIINFDPTKEMNAGTPGLSGKALATFGNVTHTDSNISLIGAQSAVLYEEI